MIYTYVHNLQGDIIAILDNTGAAVVTYSYDPWGALLSIGGSKAATLGKLNPFRYRGYVYDDETGLYYLRSRYYKPEWCRFINADTVLGKVGAVGSHNLFAYCGNNPVGRSDENGCSYEMAANFYREASMADGNLPFGDVIGLIGWGFISLYTWATMGSATQVQANTNTSVESTVAPTASPSPSPTPSPTLNPTPTGSYYFAVALGSRAPVPVSPLYSYDEMVAKLSEPYPAITTLVYEMLMKSKYSIVPPELIKGYGVVGITKNDAERLATEFSWYAPVYHPAEGKQLGHYHTTPDYSYYSAFHFWHLTQ